MARILGITIPDEKKVGISIRYIYGIGKTRSDKILEITKIPFDKRTKDLSVEEINKIQEAIEKNFKVEGDLRRENYGNIKRLREIGSYRGVRHIKRLPARGQRTKTNSRTVRGNVRKSAGSGRRKTELK